MVLSGPKLARHTRESGEEFVGEVVRVEISLDELNDVVIHEKLVERGRIFVVGDIGGCDGSRRKPGVYWGP